jgi:cathepsin B
MKGVVVLLLVCVCAAALVDAKHHGKISKKINLSKPAINKAIINEVNLDETSTWVAGINHKFQGMTLAQVKPFLGAKLGGAKNLEKRVFADDEDIIEAEALPTDFDVRTQWGSICPSVIEIRDQSDCGSCWAFGAAEAQTDRTCIASNGTLAPHLSAADLLACCDECGDGCDGGYPSSAWDYWTETGLVTGGNWSNTTTDNGCYPYPFPPCEHHVNGTHYQPCPSDEYDTPSCPNKCSNSAKWSSDKHKGKSSYYLEDLTEVQQDLYTYGSLEVAFTVYEDFLTYKSGVYQHKTGSELGGHAVKLIGWGVDSGVKYWTIANSWNSDWGDAGTFKILRGSDECGIEDEIVGGLAQ